MEDLLLLVAPGKIGLTLKIDKINDGATVSKIDPTCRFKGQIEVGDRVVTIDGLKITKIADLHVNSDKVRRFGIVKNKSSTAVIGDLSPPSVVAMSPAVSSITATTTGKAAAPIEVVVPPSAADPNKSTVPPSVASPKRKVNIPKAKEEKRLKRFRSYATTKIQERIDRALSQRLFLIETSAPSTCPQHGGPSITFSVLGSTGNVYEVTVKKVPNCSCPDAAKGNLCKHLLFVMLKVVGLPAHHQLVYQSAYLTEELEQIYSLLQARLQLLGRDVVANEEVQKVHADMKKGIKNDDDSKTVARKDVDGGECPICFDDLGSNLYQLTFCQGTCGVNFHKGCIQMWTRQSAKPTCPACRQPWEDIETGGKKSGGSPSRREGYDNLGSLQGQSMVRDTSTYHSSYDYGYKRRRYY